jgi:hypothetical protein
MKYSFDFVLFIIILTSSIFCAKGQTEINGFVKTINNTTIESANVVVYNQKNRIIAYDYTNKNGRYNITIKTSIENYIVLSAQSLGFQTKVDTLQLKGNKKKHQVSFNLIEKIEQLNEVILAPNQKISKEGNIITYKVNAFNNGTELTVEDVLKNLPGIEVLKNGTIKAHGKFIDKLLIEGEDMFDKKYVILSKNLDAKVIDAVEILNDFEDNPILAKIIKSEKVAINLVLKEDYKNIWFGNISIGLGTNKRKKLASNVGLIRKKIKFFNFNNYNNLGKKALEQLRTETSYSNSFFKEQQFEPSINPIYSIQNNKNNIFKEGQGTFNKALINSLSFVTSLKSNLKLRGTGYFTNDIENQLFSSKTIYNLNETPIVYSENGNTNFNNSTAGGELELKYTNGEKSFFKNVLVYNNKPEKINRHLLFNDKNISENLNQKDYSFHNHLNFSYLIGKKKMLHSYLYFGKNEITQNTNVVSPELNNILTLPENEPINLFSKDKISIYGGQSTILLNLGKLKTNMMIGYESLKEYRENSLVFSDILNNTSIDSIQNKTILKQQKIQFKTNTKYSLSKNVELSVGLTSDYIFINTGISKNKRWLFNPSIRLGLNNLKIGYLSFGYKRSYKELKSILFLPNFQLNNYQSLIKGQKNIHFPRKNIFSFYYNLSNEMQTKTVIIRTFYISSNGRYSTKNQISEDLILTSYRFVDSGDILSSSIDFTSYFKKLNLSTNVGSSQNWSNNPIQANTLEFKNLKTHSSSYFVTGTSYFKTLINFNFKIKLINTKSKFNNIQSKTLWKTTNFNLIYKSSDVWNATLGNKFYSTTNSNYYFIDLKINYIPKKSRFSYLFVLNNLTNENLFSINSIDEYSTYISNIKLIPRYAFILIKYRF